MSASTSLLARSKSIRPSSRLPSGLLDEELEEREEKRTLSGIHHRNEPVRLRRDLGSLLLIHLDVELGSLLMEMRSGVSFVHLGTKKIDVFLLGVEDVAESDEFGTEGRRRKRKLATSEAQTPQGERERVRKRAHA